MIVSSEKLAAEAAATGFRPDVLEKVAHLLHLLESLNRHPVLRDVLVLKGGTALNLFVFNVPRLSVDIDLNYVGARDRTEMLAVRPTIEQAVQAVCAREGYSVRRIPDEHAGGKWVLRYNGANGQGGNLDVDLNFMFRIPLWASSRRDSHLVGSWRAMGVPVLDEHELAAGKLAALFARRQARDLFDSHQILQLQDLDHERLRIAFVVYGAMNRKDWRSITLDDLSFDASELGRQLLPTLRIDARLMTKEATTYGAHLVDECRELLAAVWPLSSSERSFLDRLLDDGEIEPTLLTSDRSLQERIQHQPLLQWKAQHVREHMMNRRRSP